jgi:Sulfate permease family
VSRVESFVPSIGWLRAYDRAWLSHDLVGGLAAGAVVIPQAMAYATIADLPIQVGLYTCMVPMVVYALLGGSRTVSVSTTSTVAVLTGSTLIAAGVAAQAEDPAGDLAMLTLLVGAILLVARVFSSATSSTTSTRRRSRASRSVSASPLRPGSSPSCSASPGTRPPTTSSRTFESWSTSSAT